MNETIEKMMKARSLDDLSYYERKNLLEAKWEGKLSEDEKRHFFLLMWEDDKNSPTRKKWSDEEQAYRRGFIHGRYFGPRVSNQDVEEWLCSPKLLGCPGSPFSDQEFPDNPYRELSS